MVVQFPLKGALFPITTLSVSKSLRKNSEPLRPGRFETVKLKGIFGALRDGSPDAWGRRIIER
jgi:hypothetical protein